MTGHQVTALETVELQGERARHALQLLEQGYAPSEARIRAGLGTRELERVVAVYEHRQREMTGAPAAAPAEVTSLSLVVLRQHPANVRTDLGDLEELESTVRQHGVLQPLLVRDVGDSGYLVVDGHRRLAAALRVGLADVPVRVVAAHSDRDLDVDDVETMLVTGLTKLTLSPLDEAHGYQRLLDSGLTQREIGERVGKNQAHVSQRLALLHLTEDEQQAVRNREITVGEAYLAARERGPRRMTGEQSRPKPKRVPHFVADHPLGAAAKHLCGHETTLKLGVACGRCWERVIRADARAKAADGVRVDADAAAALAAS